MLDFVLKNFNQLVWIWIVLAIVIMPLAVNVKAPYGRHVRKGWGPTIDNKLGWVIMEFPALFVLPCFVFENLTLQSIPVWFMITFFLAHYVNRVVIFPGRINTKGKRIPVAIVLFAFIFNIINGSILGIHLRFMVDYSNDWFTDSRFIIGVVLFIIGAYINLKSDHILINLRKSGETDYKIPRRFLFQKISCPNHFGEMIEWFGFAIMTWSMAGLSFFIWTAANLIPRALNHHEWYKSNFENYPEERKAVIPYLL